MGAKFKHIVNKRLDWIPEITSRCNVLPLSALICLGLGIHSVLVAMCQ